MIKHTSDSMQFIGRVGNHSTKPSARGANLLGWGEAEAPLTDDQQREVLRVKVASLQASMEGKPKVQRADIGREICELNLKISALKGDKKYPRDLTNFICDVVKESVPRLTWERYVNEARVRAQAVEGGPH